MTEPTNTHPTSTLPLADMPPSGRRLVAAVTAAGGEASWDEARHPGARVAHGHHLVVSRNGWTGTVEWKFGIIESTRLEHTSGVDQYWQSLVTIRKRLLKEA